MQTQLDSENPELNINILGVNEIGHESGNSQIIDGRDLPWLQDIDDNGDGASDTWDSWDVTFRDVVITDTQNEKVAVYNLTNNDLAIPANFAELKQLLIESASSPTDPSLELATISDQSLLSGSPLHVPINGFDPSGGQLTFSVESSDPLVSAEVLSGNRSLRMQVDDFGVMTFELFESRAPRVTSRIIELVESGVYTDTIFHRVIDDFVLQGGDPTGTGGGDPTLGAFDDQFHVDLQHNSTGLLSMAKTTDDTNSSQFFITEGASRHLDFNHSIFGVLTEGEFVREEISEVQTDGPPPPFGNGSNRPLTDVVLHEVEVFDDAENGVLMLSAAEGATGTATITVTVTDQSGNTAVQTFDVTVATDSNNGTPFLDEIAAVRMEANSQTTFTLSAQDVEGDAVEFLGEAELSAILSPSQMPNLLTGLAYTVDSTTGVVTVTANNDLIGEHQFRVGVRASGTTGADNTIDSQLVNVTLGVITVNANDHSSGSEADDGTSDTFLLARSASASTYEISVNGENVRSENEAVVFAIDLVGSSDDDVFQIDCSGGPPVPAGGIQIAGETEQSSGDSLELDGGSFATITHRFTDASSGSITIESEAAISYTGLEPISDQLVASSNRIFEFADSDDEITVGDDGDNANGISRISSTSSSETVDFKMASGGRITIRTGAGNDQVTASDLDPTVSSPMTIGGESGNDTLDASAMTVPVTLNGGTGNDSLTGGGGNDLLNGQSGDDRVLGGAGDDNLLGGSGRDLLNGGGGNDRLRAQGFSGDTLVGSDGSDLMSGGIGFDRITVSNDSDITLGDSQLTVGSSNHQLTDIERAELSGGSTANTIDASGFSGDTTLTGGEGADTLTGSAGTATLRETSDSDLTLTNTQLIGPTTDTFSAIDRAKLVGGSSDNTFNTDSFAGPVTLRGGGGDDTMVGGAEDDLIFGGTGDDSITSGAGNDDVRAGSGNDTIDAGEGDDSIRAAAGNDLILGQAGNDTLNGATGQDTLDGGIGDDALSGLDGSDQLIGGNGVDTLVSGNGADTLDGGDGDDVLLAGNGDDSLTGGDGTDTLAGNDGDDDIVELGEVNESFSFYDTWIDRV